MSTKKKKKAFHGVQESNSNDWNMADVFEAFMEPWAEEARGTLKGYRSLVKIAAIAWNLALLPTTERKSRMLKLLEKGRDKKLQKEMREKARRHLEELITRKEDSFFSAIPVVIRDVKVIDTDEGWLLKMSTSLYKGPIGQK